MARASSSRLPSSSQPNPSRSYELDFLFSTHPTISQSDASATSRRPQCAECGTRKMRLSSGQLICKRGHVQQNFRVEQGEDDGFLGDGVARKLRAKRVVRVKKLKSQFTSLFSFPDTDVEPDDEEPLMPTSSAINSPAPSTGRATSVFLDEDEEEDDEEAADARRSRASTPSKRTIWQAGVGLQGTFEGRFSLLQCLQLVLRLQLNALRQIWGDKLPPETEAVARDLWTMLVSQLPISEFPPEPLIAATYDWHTRSQISQEEAALEFPQDPVYDPEKEVNEHRKRMLFNHYRRHHGTTTVTDVTEVTDMEDACQHLDTILQGMGTGYGFAVRGDGTETQNDSDDPEEELARLDPIFAEQRRQRLEIAQNPTAANSATQLDSQAPAPAAESESDTEQSGHKSEKKSRLPPGWVHARHVQSDWYSMRTFLKLPTTVSVIYLSLWLLKVPIMWVDLTTLIKSFQLPYLNVVHQLPIDMTRFLNHYVLDDQLGLDSDIAPTITTLHQHTVGLATFLHITYDISFGEGNQAGILTRLLKHMALPPPFYIATKRIMSSLDGITAKLVPKEQVSRKSPMSKLNNEPKEFVILAALLVLVKMRYGLDGDTRREMFHARVEDEGDTQADMLSCAPALDAWLAMLDAQVEHVKAGTSALWDMDQDLETMDMTDSQLEAYAEFAERHLVLPNQLEIYAWRREESRRHWAKFADYIPMTPLDPNTKQPSPDLEQERASQLASLYKKHVERPCALPTHAGVHFVKQCGSSYPHHQFMTDTTGLALSSLYPRVLAQANRVVGIQVVSTGIEADLAKLARSTETTKMPLESHFGIQAHLELVEQSLLENLAVRGLAPSNNYADTSANQANHSDVETEEAKLLTTLNAFVYGGDYTRRAHSAKSALRKQLMKASGTRRARIFSHRPVSKSQSVDVEQHFSLRFQRLQRERRIQAALEAINSGTCPNFHRASVLFNVPRRTLIDRAKGKKPMDQHLERLNSKQPPQ